MIFLWEGLQSSSWIIQHSAIQGIAVFAKYSKTWDTASVDFIVELLESNRKDAIMVVVDSVTKCSHFVSMVTILTAAGTTQLYL